MNLNRVFVKHVPKVHSECASTKSTVHHRLCNSAGAQYTKMIYHPCLTNNGNKYTHTVVVAYTAQGKLFCLQDGKKDHTGDNSNKYQQLVWE